MSRVSVTVHIDGASHRRALDLTLSDDWHIGNPRFIPHEFADLAALLANKIEEHLAAEYGDVRERNT
ncbi:hypothetical protein [Nocardia sp. CC227C]|uniref:hypothetical protein n=1 Tax=Nocardia sp. CC227C TaxID=3044562 RepID=UPI00278BB87E|nr:hypothetical protein [Nocardia sp. CC227C]